MEKQIKPSTLEVAAANVRATEGVEPKQHQQDTGVVTKELNSEVIETIVENKNKNIEERQEAANVRSMIEPNVQGSVVSAFPSTKINLGSSEKAIKSAPSEKSASSIEAANFLAGFGVTLGDSDEEEEEQEEIFTKNHEVAHESFETLSQGYVFSQEEIERMMESEDPESVLMEILNALHQHPMLVENTYEELPTDVLIDVVFEEIRQYEAYVKGVEESLNVKVQELESELKRSNADKEEFKEHVRFGMGKFNSAWEERVQRLENENQKQKQEIAMLRSKISGETHKSEESHDFNHEDNPQKTNRPRYMRVNLDNLRQHTNTATVNATLNVGESSATKLPKDFKSLGIEGSRGGPDRKTGLVPLNHVPQHVSFKDNVGNVQGNVREGVVKSAIGYLTKPLAKVSTSSGKQPVRDQKGASYVPIKPGDKKEKSLITVVNVIPQDYRPGISWEQLVKHLNAKRRLEVESNLYDLVNSNLVWSNYDDVDERVLQIFIRDVYPNMTLVMESDKRNRNKGIPTNLLKESIRLNMVYGAVPIVVNNGGGHGQGSGAE